MNRRVFDDMCALHGTHAQILNKLFARAVDLDHDEALQDERERNLIAREKEADSNFLDREIRVAHQEANISNYKHTINQKNNLIETLKTDCVKYQEKIRILQAEKREYLEKMKALKVLFPEGVPQ